MMLNLIQMRTAAREIFAETLRAVDPLATVHTSVRRDGSQVKVQDLSINISNRSIYSIATGKAGARMAKAIDDVFGERLTSGVITSSAGALAQIKLPASWRQFQGGHPEPNDQSLAAGRAAFDLLDRANEERALLIFLVSGGGSAMIEWPISNDISLADLRAANKVLVNCGAAIAEINSVRRAFSAVKGGLLAARAPNCEQFALIVSDVPKGQEWSVASGPTISPPKDAPDASDVIDKYALRDQLPESIVRVVEFESDAAEHSTQVGPYFILLDNEVALKAASESARQRGFVTEIAHDISDQSIDEGCNLLLNRLEQLRVKHRGSGKTVCLISGGELACPVQGEGIGGRNLETALRLANSEHLASLNAVALCAGTDGIDGNSPAAGAIVDSTTIARAKKIGLDAEDFRRRSDSYSFFIALGDVVATGATGTNVRDVRILLAAD